MADPTGHPATPLLRPFEGVHGASLPSAVVALVPYIIGTCAYTLYRRQAARDLGTGATELEISNGLSSAGYAFGALPGEDLLARRVCGD